MCELTSGKSPLCRKGFSGIAGAILGEIADIATLTATAGVITAMTMNPGTQAFKFLVEDETSSFNDGGAGVRTAGTFVVTQTLMLSNNDYATATRNSSMELSEGKYFAVVIYKNGDRKLAGVSIDKNTGAIDLDISGGLMLTTAAHTSGVAKEDKSGEDWTFEAKENVKVFTISKTISESLLDYVS